MDVRAINVPRSRELSEFEGEEGDVPREMTVEQAFLRVSRHPAIEIPGRPFRFPLFVEHVHADVCAMSIAWIASEALLDQIPRLVESAALAGGECEHAEEPPVRAVMRGEAAQQFEEFFFALLVTRETDQAEHAGRRRERHRIQRILCDRAWVAASASGAFPSIASAIALTWLCSRGVVRIANSRALAAAVRACGTCATRNIVRASAMCASAKSGSASSARPRCAWAPATAERMQSAPMT